MSSLSLSIFYFIVTKIMNKSQDGIIGCGVLSDDISQLSSSIRPKNDHAAVGVSEVIDCDRLGRKLGNAVSHSVEHSTRSALSEKIVFDAVFMSEKGTI